MSIEAIKRWTILSAWGQYINVVAKKNFKENIVFKQLPEKRLNALKFPIIMT